MRPAKLLKSRNTQRSKKRRSRRTISGKSVGLFEHPTAKLEDSEGFFILSKGSPDYPAREAEELLNQHLMFRGPKHVRVKSIFDKRWNHSGR